MTLIETEARDGVFYVTLNDQARRNALSRQLLVEFTTAIDAFEADPELRVAVVTNAGRVFCAGADLAEQTSAHGEGEGRTAGMSDLLQRIRLSPKPFVGRIAGHCVAGGVGLAAVMDVSIAVDTASFGFTEVRVGVAPAMISVVCLPKMRAGDARATFLRGNRFSAIEAARVGLINQAVSESELDHAVVAVVNDLLAGEPRALAEAKRLTYLVPSLSVDDAFAMTSRLSAELFASDAAREGMTAFLDKRPASWVRRVSTESDGE